jgi:kynurenine formamidase
MQYIDLSHTVFDGLVTYKGLPAPIICDYLSREASKSFYEEGTSFQIGRIDMAANTGTYLDCPFHRYEHGKDLSEIFLHQVAYLPALVIRAEGQNAIGPGAFHNQDVRGKAVLVHTGWSSHWNTEKYFYNHPFLTEAAAIFLKEKGAILVGIDSHNIDDTSGNRRPVHSTLLGADILIVEHMTRLDLLPDVDFRFSAVPPKVKGMGTFPVRAFAAYE